MPGTEEDERGRAEMKVLTLEEENAIRAIGNLPPLQRDARSPLEVRPLEVRPLEARPLEVRPLEVRPLEVRPLEVRPLEVRPLEVRPLEVRPLEFFRILVEIATQNCNRIFQIYILPGHFHIAAR